MTKDVLKGRSIVSKNIFDQVNQSIEEIKRNNPIVDYFISRGVELKPTGKGQLMGLCPFHDDHNPSLSVNDEKNIFKCFGCGKSGTVIDAVSYFENILTGEAIRKLQGKKSYAKGTKFGDTEKENTDNDLKLDISDLEPPNIPPEETKEDANADGRSDLNTITEYYHKKLYENQKALDYLSKRGLKNPEIWERFKIGFADGNLLNIIGENQKEELKKSGILRENGNQHFAQCIVFPVFDDACGGHYTGIYGRNIDDKAKIKHLYLRGKHTGVFNRKASKVYDEIILTESIIDALSLIETGFENVQSCYGVNGFTDEHLQTLKDDRVKLITVAFDNDEAGKKASESLKEKLVKEGFEVKCIFPPEAINGKPCKDWNESLQDGIIREEIQEFIDKAEVFKPTPTAGFTVKVDGSTYIFIINEITYRLFDVKEIFVTNLKVSIKAGYQGEIFPDKVDLYSSRSRNSYSLTLSKAFNVEPKRIEKDLIKIIEYLEKERDKRLTSGSNNGELQAVVITEEERKIGLEFLKSPTLFEDIVADMSLLGYVGEDLNKQLIYLCASSRILDDPVSVLILSQSASGKSMLVETVRKLLPPEEVIAITSLSDQALNYIGNLKHKFLVFGEAVHNETIEHQIREMLSSKELSRLVTQKDEKTGKMTSQIVRKDVMVSAVMSSTNHKINPENLSRFFVVNTDESREQTKRVHEMQRRKYSLERINEKKEQIPEIIKKHQASQRILQKYSIVNPFGSYLNFPDNLMRSRRDNDRFIDLIACVCFLRQYQKEVKTEGEISFIECDLTDYEIAYRIMVNGILPATMQEIPKSSLELHEALRKMATNLSKKNNLKINEVSFTQREVRDQTGYGQTWIKDNLRILVDYEYVTIVRGGNQRTKGYYRLKEDELIPNLNLSTIPTVEEIKLKITKTINLGELDETGF